MTAHKHKDFEERNLKTIKTNKAALAATTCRKLEENLKETQRRTRVHEKLNNARLQVWENLMPTITDVPHHRQANRRTEGEHFYVPRLGGGGAMNGPDLMRRLETDGLMVTGTRLITF